MKYVVLSAGGGRGVYLVPGEAADNLRGFCLDFCGSRLRCSPKAAKHRVGGGCNETAFIEYLAGLFQASPPRFAESLGWTDFGEPLPGKYRGCPEFNF